MRTPEALTTLNITDTVFWEVHYVKHVTTLREKNLLPPSSGKKIPYTSDGQTFLGAGPPPKKRKIFGGP